MIKSNVNHLFLLDNRYAFFKLVYSYHDHFRRLKKTRENALRHCKGNGAETLRKRKEELEQKIFVTISSSPAVQIQTPAADAVTPVIVEPISEIIVEDYPDTNNVVSPDPDPEVPSAVSTQVSFQTIFHLRQYGCIDT